MLTIQLLGTQDDIVSPKDNIDFVTGKKFRYIDVPDSNHSNIIELNGNKDSEGLTRKNIFKCALTYIEDKSESCKIKKNSGSGDCYNLSEIF